MLLLVGGVGFGKMSGFHYTGNEGGLTMIQKELKTIKSFGSQLESTVTMEDIAAKEKRTPSFLGLAPCSPSKN